MTNPVVLSKQQQQLAESLVDSGRFASIDDVIGEGLRLVAERQPTDEEKLETLRAAVQVGLDDIEHGRYVEFDNSEDLRLFLQDLLISKPEPE